MKFLIIGLGSMGKRRIRCLQSMGYFDIKGFDIREDRKSESRLKYSIDTFESLDKVISEISIFDAIIISTPPEHHSYYAKLAIDACKPSFIEASVIIEHVKEVKSYNKNNTFIAPSCTLRFHPIIKDITAIIKKGRYGKVTNFSYHSGQYLPDWHPWEKIEDFYVSNRLTGGGREIVPFELTWIVDTIGWPVDAKGIFQKTINLGVNIEDTYAFVLKYNDMAGSIVVDVAARYATRSLIINMELGQIQWRWDENCFNLYEARQNRWIKYNQPDFISENGYNKNIGETMYIEEVNCFINAIKAPGTFPHTINDDIKILEILSKIENSDGGF